MMSSEQQTFDPRLSANAVAFLRGNTIEANRAAYVRMEEALVGCGLDRQHVRDEARLIANEHGHAASVVRVHAILEDHLGDRRAWAIATGSTVVEFVEDEADETLPVAESNGLREIVDMMDRAAAAQKRAPRIVLERDGMTVVLLRAGAKSRYEGDVQVVGPGSFHDRRYYGRIQRDGTYIPSRPSDRVDALLEALADDPTAVAAQHGVATGSCCFCAKPLSTKESRSVGYGPICAEKFGLPWGDTTAADEADKQARV